MIIALGLQWILELTTVSLLAVKPSPSTIQPECRENKKTCGNWGSFRFILVDKYYVAFIFRKINCRKATGYDHSPLH